MNGHDITKLSNPAAVTLIKNQPSKVTISILRPADSSDAPVKPPRTDQPVQEKSTSSFEDTKAASIQRERPQLSSQQETETMEGTKAIEEPLHSQVCLFIMNIDGFLSLCLCLVYKTSQC